MTFTIPGENELREVIVKNLVSAGEREREGGWGMGNGSDNICKSMRLHPSPSPRFAASAPRSRVLARLASLAQIGELAHRLSLLQ